MQYYNVYNSPSLDTMVEVYMLYYKCTNEVVIECTGREMRLFRRKVVSEPY